MAKLEFRRAFSIIVAACAATTLLASAVLAKTAAELEKEKAMANPYPNDLGPLKLGDDVLKSYPSNIQQGYRLMLQRCTVCHTSARPLNSNFVELEGKTPADKEANVATLKKTHPEYFKSPADPDVWKIDAHIWSRYVHRMMSKPGCNVGSAGKQIWEFLVYDGVHRKLGANASSWKAQREKLLKQFQAQFPQRFKDLVSQGELKPI